MLKDMYQRIELDHKIRPKDQKTRADKLAISQIPIKINAGSDSFDGLITVDDCIGMAKVRMMAEKDDGTENLTRKFDRKI